MNGNERKDKDANEEDEEIKSWKIEGNPSQYNVMKLSLSFHPVQA